MRTIEDRQRYLADKRVRLQAIVDLKAQGHTYQSIAEIMGLNSHQRAWQMHGEARREGMTPTE